VRTLRREKGFTLIEILLVVVIMGIMLAVIVPRAWRANIDSKYGLVRQAGSEMASFGTTWAEEQIIAQQEMDDATMYDYLTTLGEDPNGTWTPLGNWTAAPADSVVGRAVDPATNVQGIVPPEKHPRNPFNGASYFASANNATAVVIPGALLAAQAADTGDFVYFALIFLGTDSTGVTDFHAGMDTSLAGLRNGVFFARTTNFNAGP